MRRMISLIILITLCQCGPIYAQPSQEVLDQISIRGKLLAEYERISWIGSDFIEDLKPAPGLVEQYIARKIGNEWEVVFGAVNEAGNAFVVNYKYTNDLAMAKSNPLPYEDTGFYLKAAMAIKKALEDFNKVNPYDRPFNVAVLPEDTDFYVYIYPGQLQKDVYPLGGDWRYRIDGSTGQVLETRQLHKVILELEPPPGNDATGFHVAVMDDIPEDTDVLYVLMRKPSSPELIISQKYVYKVKTDGAIEFLGLRDEVLGKK